MAGFRTHITVAATLGVSYGLAANHSFGFTPGAAVLAAGLTALGGMLPDLDSDSGVPLRELSAVSAGTLPLIALPRLIDQPNPSMTMEGIFATLGLLYLFGRYGISCLLAKFTVHRGMFHSIPAMLIAGLSVYLAYGTPYPMIRVLLAGGVMLGFLSHLILDEIYSVDFQGLRVRLKSSAGSALKLFSSSLGATTACYTILGALLYAGYMEWQHGRTVARVPDIRLGRP